ncbi:polysaccharide deacetylase family protein [Paenibacillus sp. 1P07SE]|uniref:polysaccharide deacetylase family protein n=1 Tax=Paenibacillus sp. 1P07SE TaxID=3132209 RepID=UPI0039A5FAE8
MRRTKLLSAFMLSMLLLGCGAAGGEPTGDTPDEQRGGIVTGMSDTVRSQQPETPPLTLDELRRKYPETFIFHGPQNARVVALTFDDAPDDIFTPLVLDALREAGVQATFFVVGERVEKYPEVMRRLVREGHIVGNHSYNHANLPRLSESEFRSQITRTDELIRQYTGYVPSYIRPPYGNINEPQLQWLAAQQRKVVNWNVDSLDWKDLPAEEVVDNILSAVKPGAIILQHSGGGVGADLTGTAEAIPTVVARLKEQGYSFATIPRLLGEH